MKVSDLLLETDSQQLLQIMTRGYRNIPIKIQPVNVEKMIHPASSRKQCYNNAFKALTHDGLRDNDRYVLGIMIFMGVPIEHAWIKKDGKYFDPTLDPKSNDAYYSITELTHEQLQEFVEEKGHAPDLSDYDRFLRSKK